jgi:hypothetical protein
MAAVETAGPWQDRPSRHRCLKEVPWRDTGLDNRIHPTIHAPLTKHGLPGARPPRYPPSTTTIQNQRGQHEALYRSRVLLARALPKSEPVPCHGTEE